MVTFICIFAVLLPDLAVMTVVPAFFAVTFPLLDTVATEDLELDHVIPVLPASVESCIVPPTFIGIVMQLILEDESVSEEGYVAFILTFSVPLRL